MKRLTPGKDLAAVSVIAIDASKPIGNRLRVWIGRSDFSRIVSWAVKKGCGILNTTYRWKSMDIACVRSSGKAWHFRLNSPILIEHYNGARDEKVECVFEYDNTVSTEDQLKGFSEELSVDDLRMWPC